MEWHKGQRGIYRPYMSSGLLGYSSRQRLGHAEREISWLNRMLKAVKDHDERHLLELKDRLDVLE
jgi:hypothetical protein